MKTKIRFFTFITLFLKTLIYYLQFFVLENENIFLYLNVFSQFLKYNIKTIALTIVVNKTQKYKLVLQYV